jgi:hypothetical protein
MGCSNSKSTKSLPVLVAKDPPSKQVQLNPHDEDEAAEVIDHGKKTINKDHEALDNLSQMKKDESKTTLADPSLLSKTVIVEMPNNTSIVEPQGGNNVSLMNVSKITTEKPTFEKVEHKFEFDLDLEERKEPPGEHHGIINDVIKELDDI